MFQVIVRVMTVKTMTVTTRIVKMILSLLLPTFLLILILPSSPLPSPPNQLPLPLPPPAPLQALAPVPLSRLLSRPPPRTPTLLRLPLHPRLTPADSKHIFYAYCSPFSHPYFSATWFTQNGNAGACGNTHSDNDFIAALDYRTYGDTSAKSKYCGEKIRVTWQGKSVDVIVADACPTCENSASVDLSVAAFEALAPLKVGELDDSKYLDQSPLLIPLTIVPFHLVTWTLL